MTDREIVEACGKLSGEPGKVVPANSVSIYLDDGPIWKGVGYLDFLNSYDAIMPLWKKLHDVDDNCDAFLDAVRAMNGDVIALLATPREMATAIAEAYVNTQSKARTK